MSVVLHGAAWYAWVAWLPVPEPVETPPQVIEVALMTALQPTPEPLAQAPAEPAAKPQVQPEKPPERPAPKKPDKPKPKRKPVASLEVPPTSSEHAPATPVEAPPAAVAAPEPAQTAPPPPAAPYVEASYKAPGLNNPPTRYPRIALERQWEGSVVLKVQVAVDGRPVEIRVERSSGHEILDDATVEQVKNWHFTPARRGDQAVASWVLVPIEYKLKH